MDIISKLPLGIIETILCFLPIQEAARTSILSKEWRYHWTKIPKLVFIEDTFQVSTFRNEPSVLEQSFDEPSKRKYMAKRCKLFYAIYQVLLIHQGPIYDFTLRMIVDGSCVEIDHIILHLSKKNTVKTLKLDLLRGIYTIPLSFYSLHQLTELYLNGCALEHQPSSNGFSRLTTLHIHKIWTCEKVLLRFLSGCPLLKKVTINSDCTTIATSGKSATTDLIECLPVVEYLSVSFYIALCFDPRPKELSTTLVHLKYLCMHSLCFYHKDAFPFLALLIRSSPNLEKLKLELLAMQLVEDEDMGTFTLEDYLDITLEHLNEVEIVDFSNEDNELVLLKLILAKSPVLKNASILIWDDFDEDDKVEIAEGISRLPCASPDVEVEVSW